MAQMSPYEGLTPERIKAEMLTGLSVRGAELDIREGSYTNTLVSVAAYQLFQLYQEFPGLLAMVFPDETSGEYLDRHAWQIGMVRQSGARAVAAVVFTGTDGVTVPQGTVLQVPESGLRFATRETVVLADGTATAEAEAEDVGADYNVPPGSITSMAVNLTGVTTVTNPAAAAGGAYVESDADFFARYHLRRTLPVTSGNANHYIQWAREVAGVSYASCIPLWNGNGTVKVILAGADKSAVDEAIRAACAAHIEAQRPIGATVTVVSVTPRLLPLTAQVTLAEGATVEAVTQQLTASVSAMLAAQPFGTALTIPFSRFLACLLQCPGVADYAAMTVDGAARAVTLAAETVPQVGTVTVTEGSV